MTTPMIKRVGLPFIKTEKIPSSRIKPPIRDKMRSTV